MWNTRRQDRRWSSLGIDVERIVQEFVDDDYEKPLLLEMTIEDACLLLADNLHYA